MGPHATVLYDLDTGQRLEIEDKRKWKNQLETAARYYGLDLCVKIENGTLTFIAFDTKIIQLQPSEWTALSPEQLFARLSGAMPEGRVLHTFDKRPPVATSFAFRTRDGGVGIFRIMSWIDDAPGVRVGVKVLRKSQVSANVNEAREADDKLPAYVGLWVLDEGQGADGGFIRIESTGVMVVTNDFGGVDFFGKVDMHANPLTFSGNNENGTIRVEGDVLIVENSETLFRLRRWQGDPRFVGNWKAVEITGELSKRVTAAFLDINEDGSFILQTELPEPDEPMKGIYRIDGNRIDLGSRVRHSGFISTLDADQTIRLTTDDGTIVLRRDDLQNDDLSHFIGKYRMDKEFSGGAVWSFEISRIGDTYHYRDFDGPDHVMTETSEGLAVTDGGERFVFRFDSATRVYSLAIYSVKDGSLQGVAPLQKVSGKSNKLRFFSIMERTNDDLEAETQTLFLDLDTGQQIGFKQPPRPLLQWLQKQGADLVVDYARNGMALPAVDMVLNHVGVEEWKTFKPEDFPIHLVPKQANNVA